MAALTLPKDPLKKKLKLEAIDKIYTEPPLSYQEVADEIGVHKQTVSNWMLEPDQKHIELICSACERIRKEKGI